MILVFLGRVNKRTKFGYKYISVAKTEWVKRSDPARLHLWFDFPLGPRFFKRIKSQKYCEKYDFFFCGSKLKKKTPG